MIIAVQVPRLRAVFIFHCTFYHDVLLFEVF
jgi:hypothetical protein